MKAKKFLAFGLAATMAVGTIAGCSTGDNKETTVANQTTADQQGGANTETSAVIPTETVTINVLSQVANFSGIQPGWSGDVFLEKFNVKMNLEQDIGGKLSTRIANEDLGDIVVWGSMGEEYYQAADQGLLLNWNKNNLLDNYGSFIKENLADAIALNAEFTDGTVYGFRGGVSLEGSSNSDGLIYTWDTRWDLYDQLGQPVINNLDDYLNLMLAMKEICPKDENGKDTYALSMWPDWDGNMVMYVKAFATAYYGYDEWGFGLYDVKTGKLHGCLESEGPYYVALKFINKLYQNGLVDPASMSQNYDQMAEKMLAGGCFFSIFKYAGQDIYNTQEHIDENKMMCSLIPNDATPIIYEVSTQGSGYYWTIGAKTQYPELCMSIINWLATPEGFLTYLYGPQGECWDYDANGVLYLTELGQKCQKNKKKTELPGHTGSFNEGSFQVNSSIWGSSSLIPGDKLGQSFFYKFWDSYSADALCASDQSWRDFTGETLATSYLLHKSGAIFSPSTGVQSTTPDSEDPLSTDWAQLQTIIKNGSWKCVYATSDAEFDKLFADMQAEGAKFNYDACIAYSQKEADARYAIEQSMKK